MKMIVDQSHLDTKHYLSLMSQIGQSLIDVRRNVFYHLPKGALLFRYQL